MKKRTTKKQVQKEESHLAATLWKALLALDQSTNEIGGTWSSQLGSDLTFLLSQRLRLISSWPGQKYWLDCIEWESLIAGRPSEIRGVGQIWWGYSNNLSGALTSECLTAKIQLKKKNRRSEIAYSVMFTIDGVSYHVQR